MWSPKNMVKELAFSLLKLSDRMSGVVPYDQQMSSSWALGATLTLDLIRFCPQKITCIYASDERKHEHYHDESILRAREAGISVVHDERAFTARAGRRRYSILCTFDKWEDRLEPSSHVVIVNAHNTQNIGAIFRSALAFGVHDIAIITDIFDSFEPQLIRASMGTRLQLRVEVFSSIEAYLARFPENTRYAFMLDAATPLRQLEKREPYSLFVGNESVGLPPEYAELCQPVFIEQSPQVDSLNVSVAASIALYEFSSF